MTGVLADGTQDGTQSSSLLRWKALLVRAPAKRVLGDLKGAIADLQQANAIEPLTGVPRELQKEYITALREAQPPQELMDKDALTKHASAMLSQQNVAATVAALDALAELNPSVPEARYQCAAMKGRFGHYEAALQDLQLLMVEDASYRTADILYMRSLCNAGLGKLPEAVQDLNAALTATEASMNKADILYLHGKHQKNLGNSPAALHDVQAALTAATARTPSDKADMLFFCSCALHDHPAALQLLDEALRLTPEDVNILCQRGSVKTTLGDLEGALEDASTAVHLAPDLGHTWWLQAMVYDAMCMPDVALSIINKADSLEPDNQGILELRGKCRLDIRDFAGAVSDFERAAQLGLLNEANLQARAYAQQMLRQPQM